MKKIQEKRLYKKAIDLKRGDQIISVNYPDKVGKQLVKWNDFLKTCDKSFI